MIAISTIFVSCAKTTETTSAPTSAATQAPTSVVTQAPTTTATSGLWAKLGTPTYGGTITVGAVLPEGTGFDPHNMLAAEGTYIFDGLFNYNWGVDPSIHPLKGEFVTADYYEGELVDTWEYTDPLTVTVHLKQGIHWQNLPPVNGREFTADDVIYNYDRVLGNGDGFTTPNQFYAPDLSDIDQVVKIDKYTVDFKLKQSNYWTIYQVLYYIPLGAPEVLDKIGTAALSGGGGPGGPPAGGAPASSSSAANPATDTKNGVGTGPWIINQYSPNVSISYNRNPDYFMKDERHPQNQLPYADQFKELSIPDSNTRLAAFRTYKIDFIRGPDSPSMVDLSSLLKTTPDTQTSPAPTPGFSLSIDCAQKPFTDINVRKALQMSLNLPLIAKTLYNGAYDGVPAGLVNPIEKGWCTPFAQWPASLQAEYSYNPTEAKKLLTDAGYPNGFDTTVTCYSGDDMNLLQAIKSMFADINVNMTINAMGDKGAFFGTQISGHYNQLTYFLTTGNLYGPLLDIEYRTKSEFRNWTANYDPVYEAMYAKLAAATDLKDAQALCNEADQYALSQHWEVATFPMGNNAVWQPYLKGYSGESFWAGGTQYFARFWVDQTLEKTLSP